MYEDLINNLILNHIKTWLFISTGRMDGIVFTILIVYVSLVGKSVPASGV